MRLGERINRLRLEKRESLQDVAGAVGVSKAHIWELEKGRTDNPAMALVTRLADHFGVTVSYLVGEDIEAPDEDDELRRMFRQAHDLDERDRQTLDALLQSFLTRKGEAG
jgi:transcriptional regulator with XRE-family HTH domain